MSEEKVQMREIIFWDGPGMYFPIARSWEQEIGGGQFVEWSKLHETHGGTPRRFEKPPEDMQVAD
jgi:hypothetical protein